MEYKYIGKNISYKMLKEAILNFNLNEDYTIVLNYNNFDDIVLEYRDIYSEEMIFPHYLLGVEIREEENNESVPQNRIGIIKNE
ncbi:MAG: hypothetical protein H6Q16_872 [Bacteroidetes bacterium]|nr:hypothetical protein [Bacteroidota bacterium]